MATTGATAIQHKRLRGEHGLDTATLPGQFIHELAGQRSATMRTFARFLSFQVSRVNVLTYPLLGRSRQWLC